MRSKMTSSDVKTTSTLDYMKDYNHKTNPHWLQPLQFIEVVKTRAGTSTINPPRLV